MWVGGPELCGEGGAWKATPHLSFCVLESSRQQDGVASCGRVVTTFRAACLCSHPLVRVACCRDRGVLVIRDLGRQLCAPAFCRRIYREALLLLRGAVLIQAAVVTSCRTMFKFAFSFAGLVSCPRSGVAFRDPIGACTT